MTPHLIGGEMVLWADRDPAGGPVLRHLVAAVTGRTLVVGPHEPGLLDAVPAPEMTVLVRGAADAEALAARFAGREGVTVCCGSLEKLSTTPAYDCVVALDGLGRLSSAETTDLSWAECLGVLLAALRPGGHLLLGLENLLGIQQLVGYPSEAGDADWGAPAELDRTRPAGPAQLRADLEHLGLQVLADYAAYPAPAGPTALLATDVLADPELNGFLEATLRAAFMPASAHQATWSGTVCTAVRAEQVLTDPGRLAARALRRGLAAELAPAWFVLARRGHGESAPAGPGSAAPAGPGTAAPAALVSSGGSVREVRPDTAGRWAFGAGRPVPRGRTLEDLLLAAVLRRDLPVMRELLGSWQCGESAGVPADQLVVGADGTVHGMVPAGDPVAALHRFVVAVLDAGLTHLWPAPADEAELTALVAAMAGRDLDPTALPALSAAARSGAPGLREVVTARDRLARELSEARAKHDWYERMLVARESELKRVRRLNAVLAATRPGRAATALLGVWRAGRRVARTTLRRLRA